MACICSWRSFRSREMRYMYEHRPRHLRGAEVLRDVVEGVVLRDVVLLRRSLHEVVVLVVEGNRGELAKLRPAVQREDELRGHGALHGDAVAPLRRHVRHDLRLALLAEV